MYTKEMSWADWVYQLNILSGGIKRNVDRAKEIYDKWYNMTYGLTDEQILALPCMTGKVQNDLNNVKFAMGTFKDMSEGLYGVAALTQSNRSAYLIPFI